MNELSTFVAVMLFSYLCGSIPTAYLLGRFSGLDIRNHGSGNVGATNVLRVMGTRSGMIVLALDTLKGFIPACLAPFYFESNLLIIMAASLSIVGHMYPVWLGFRGGKGVATSLGAFLALTPKTILFGFIIFVMVVLLTRYVSMGSVVAVIVVTLAIFIQGKLLLGLVAMGIAGLIVYRHKPNLQRILNGTENKLF